MKNFLNFYYPEGDDDAGSGAVPATDFNLNENSPFVPKTRKQKYLSAIAGLYEGKLPDPKTRKETYLFALTDTYEGELPEPKTVDEYMLYTKASAESEHAHKPAGDDDSGEIGTTK